MYRNDMVDSRATYLMEREQHEKDFFSARVYGDVLTITDRRFRKEKGPHYVHRRVISIVIIPPPIQLRHACTTSQTMAG